MSTSSGAYEIKKRVRLF